MDLDALPPEVREKTGIAKIANGTCPIGGVQALSCFFCPFGHMLECHYPKSCSEARCSHYLADEVVEENSPELPYSWAELDAMERRKVRKEIS